MTAAAAHRCASSMDAPPSMPCGGMMPCAMTGIIAIAAGAGGAGAARRGRLGRTRLGLSPSSSPEAAALRTVFTLPSCR